MASKHLWIAELQDRDGKAVEYHSLELEPEHYEKKGDWNRAMTSWSNFRQRERGNLKCNRPRNSRCKWAVSWRPADDAAYQLFGLPEGIKHHKTIWDLYEAIGYNYKAKKYERAVTVYAIDPGSEGSAVETTFEDGKLVQIRTLEPEDNKMPEPRRMRGDAPGLVHIDEAGFLSNDGRPVYSVTGGGEESRFVVRNMATGEFVAFDEAPPPGPLTVPIPEKIGVIATSSTAETVTVTERAAMGAGMVAEPASLEEANRLRAKVGLDPLFAQPIPEVSDPGFAQETPQINDPGFAVAPEIAAFAAEGNAPEGFEITAPNPGAWQEPVVNPFNGLNVTAAQAQAIAAKVNAEPDVEAKKRILQAELRFHAADQVRNAVVMPGDKRNDPRVIAHKKGVVKAHQKLKRQQAKAEKMKALQVKAFSGK